MYPVSVGGPRIHVQDDDRITNSEELRRDDVDHSLSLASSIIFFTTVGPKREKALVVEARWQPTNGLDCPSGSVERWKRHVPNRILMTFTANVPQGAPIVQSDLSTTAPIGHWS